MNIKPLDILAKELQIEIRKIHRLNLGLNGYEEYLAKRTLIEEVKRNGK